MCLFSKERMEPAVSEAGASGNGNVTTAGGGDASKKLSRLTSDRTCLLGVRRSLSDAIRRAEASPDNLLLRQRVKDCAIRVMFADPLELGRQAEEVLWRKAFYEPLARFKSKRDQMGSSRQLVVEQLLLSGLGTYQQLLSRLELDFDAPLAGIVNVSLSRQGWGSGTGRRLEEFPEERHDELRKWALHCAHRCFIALGDLCRYLYDLTGGSQRGALNCPYRAGSIRFYHQAILSRSSQGQPFNQLATLTTNELAGLKAAYFYFRCLLSPEPFPGAKNNLNSMFEKNRNAVAQSGGGSTGGSVVPTNWEAGVRMLLMVAERLWKSEVPDEHMTPLLVRFLRQDRPLRSDVQFYALVMMLALNRKHADATAKGDNNQSESCTNVIEELLFTLGGRILRELHHRICLRTCSVHPFNEPSVERACPDKIDGDLETNDKIDPLNSTVARSSGDPGEGGSVKRQTAKPKIVRRRRALGDADSDEDDEIIGSGLAVAGRGRRADAGGRHPNSDDGANSAEDEVVGKQRPPAVPHLNGSAKAIARTRVDVKNRSGKAAMHQTNRRRHNSSGESSEDSMSSSAGWSSSSDGEDILTDDDEASDDGAPEDSDDDTTEAQGLSDDEHHLGKGSAVKSATPRFSPHYSLNKALSCRQLVKQVVSEGLLAAAKLFLDWVVASSPWTSAADLDREGNASSARRLELQLGIAKHVADLANLLCIIKHRVMLSSDSTIEHVRDRLAQLSTHFNNNTKKQDEADMQSLAETRHEDRRELILPEDIHCPLEAAPALKGTAAMKRDEQTKITEISKADWMLSWEERTNLATEGQCAVYRMHLIIDRAATICGRLNGASVLAGERITFSQDLHERIAEVMSRETAPLPSGQLSNGRPNNRERGRGGQNVRGAGRGERGAGDSEKQQVAMKSMAHAWLRHEVEGLEERLEACATRAGGPSMKDSRGSSIAAENHGGAHNDRVGAGSSGGGSWNGNGGPMSLRLCVQPVIPLSPFIVVDSSALSTRLLAVRTIALQRKSIIAVPTCVLSSLDEMKKDVAQARDATRWLEAEMRRGSRFVQVLGPGEASRISLLKYPKRKDREAWNLFQLLECCHHLGNGKHGRSHDPGHKTFRAGPGGASQGNTVLVSLVVAKAERTLPSNAASLADAIGVKLIDIDDVFGRPIGKQTTNTSGTMATGSSNGSGGSKGNNTNKDQGIVWPTTGVKIAVASGSEAESRLKHAGG